MDQQSVFYSDEMKDIFNMAKRYAQFKTTILINGETGVGKEVVAKLIHKYSNRASMPFLTVNCGAIPESLLDSELFGYESGAFTGANTKGSMGLFESAHKGTLLLDEIGELSPLLQVKLLRVLQEHEVRRIGGSWSKSIDVRIIACTNADLWNLVENGTFRKDLYFRLSVATITIPPLRERKADILPLLEQFLHELISMYNIDRTFDKSALYVITNHTFYGNVRELRNIVESSYITALDNIITINDLPKYLIESSSINLKTITENCSHTLDEMLNDYEKEIITNALTHSNTIRKAAIKLGISNTTLLRRIKVYNLEEKINHHDDFEADIIT
ncbi:sigma-54 interaction domain-containing protein [Sedimentibacter saalensis]|uniref:HTH-type transcriptional regulatory protein TyrR n=1 Tax=Sedimentibacter saalensis TaxID=130788 RepID=A0A562JL61_9FIRM|nr:sigma-54 dependent transcriptional regulator [Sedimentibacter saalensis]TWH83615.1 regulatory Fis family protein [Sedimentibacter saalensis]